MGIMISHTTRACLTAIVLVATFASAEESERPKPAAVTTTDPKISLDDLRLLVKPLTRDELAHEATAWRDLLRDKVAEISRLQLATKEPERQEKGGEVAALAEDLAHSQEQRSSLLDRLRIVLDEWQRKGGDPAEYRLYATAVGGLQVDVTNATTAMTVIQGWLFSEQGGIRWAWNIGKFLAILVAFWLLSLILSGLVGQAATRLRGDTSLLKTFLVTFVRQATLVVGGIVSLAALEVNISPLLALIGGAAFVVGFALQGTLSNFAQGLIILAYRPFDVGDYIEAAGVGGIVESMNMLMTTIRTVDNKQVIVPNGKIGSDSIVNATASSIRRVDLTFGVSYTDDLTKVQGQYPRRLVGELHRAAVDEDRRLLGCLLGPHPEREGDLRPRRHLDSVSAARAPRVSRTSPRSQWPGPGLILAPRCVGRYSKGLTSCEPPWHPRGSRQWIHPRQRLDDAAIRHGRADLPLGGRGCVARGPGVAADSAAWRGRVPQAALHRLPPRQGGRGRI
jgi:small conductance mechanosensitive channel